ncbi:MAG: threonine--tRNA ligase [Candidatus Hodarchaeales archaeon]
MQLLLIHSQGFAWKVNEKALKEAEALKGVSGEYSTNDSVLIVFVAIELTDIADPKNIINQATHEIGQALSDIGEKNVIIYPWVHLVKNQPADPKNALKILKMLAKNTSTSQQDITVIRAPFGYYKSFTLNCKGHALAERSKDITGQKVEKESVEVVTALKAEDESKSEFFIVTPKGEKIQFDKFDYAKFKDLETFVKYETAKDRRVSSPPKHVEIMKKLELIDYELGSDAGNFRILPRGYIIKNLIENHVINMAIEYGAMIVETPLMYSYEHPSLKKYLERFPARQYIVKSGTKDYFLRFAACFGQFLCISDAIFSYRQLPVKIFEMAKSFRREQRGELAGIRRLRAFTMPDLHTVAIDMEMAKQEFENQFTLATQYMKDIEIDFETAFRMTTKFYEENENWILEMIKRLGKPVLLELFSSRYAYFILKFEFNVVDTQLKAAALSTVQIDVENSERFDIKYVNEKGQNSFPLLLHCSLSGSTERVIYAILEDQLKKSKKGVKPQFPLWLAPTQVRILPVTENFLDYATDISAKIENEGIRVEIDDRDMSLGKKIRAAEKLWTPLIVVVGKREVEEKKLNVRFRSDNSQKVLSVEDLINYVKKNTADMPRISRVFPKLVSKQPIFTREV